MRQIVAANDAVFERLKAQLAPIGVYTYVPRDAVLPYVIVGQHVPTPQDPIDGDDFVTQHLITVTAYSGYRGMKEVLQILEAIEGALHLFKLQMTSGAAIGVRYLRGDAASAEQSEDSNGTEASYIGSAIIEVLTEA